VRTPSWRPRNNRARTASSMRSGSISITACRNVG
jgi:hypothetical protein